VRILFVQDNGLNESLALTEASALLMAHGHRCQLTLTREEPDLEATVRARRPDLVVVVGSILARGFALDSARRVAALGGPPAVLCGTLPTFFPEVVLDPAVHAIVVGEADEALLELAEALGQGQAIEGIPNLRVARDGAVVGGGVRPMIADLDSLPLPDRALYYRFGFLRDFPWKKFTAGRGCVHHCSYCYQPSLRRMYADDPHYMRLKSPGRVVAEVLDLRRKAALGHVHFSDDLFTVDGDWVTEVSGRLRAEVGLPFTCNTSAELVTARVARDLARGGCVAVAIGVESGDERLRCERILHKDISDAMIRQAAAHIREAGLRLVTFNMIGAPGETLEQALATLRFNRELGADHVRINFAYPIPGTAMFQQAVQQGLLDPAQAAAMASEQLELEPGPILKHPHAQALERLLRLYPLLLRLPASEQLAPALLRLPSGALGRLLGLYAPLLEQRIFRLPWWQGLRYYRHVGSPAKRTTNFTSLP
jgi:anaerobic magnesium-protoporphyrin IX monomethyl ester cyclase